jgi:hypothetical protein
MIILSYISKMVLCSAILTGYYWFFLRNRRFHHYNRFFLLLTLLLSVTLPFISLPVSYQPENKVNTVLYRATEALSIPHRAVSHLAPNAGTPGAVSPAATTLLTLENILWTLYAGGVVYFLFVLCRSLLYLRRLARKYPPQQLQQLRFHITQEPGTPFSFFRAVYWNNQLDISSQEGQQIFRHELFHVQQQHSADILLAELITAFGWFNPCFYLLKKEIKAIHEFLADQHAISGNDRFAYAELLVQQVLKERKLSVSNYFFQNHIKRRITMITQFNQTKYGYWSRVMALPVLLVLSCLVTLKAQQVSAQSEKPLLVLHASKDVYTVIPGSNTSPTKAEVLTHKQAVKTGVPTATANMEATNIDIEKVRSLMREITTMQKVLELFGEPSQKMLSPGSHAWVYEFPQSHLRIDFDRKTDTITDFVYAQNMKQAVNTMTYEAVRNIKEESTTGETILKQFGQPTAISIAPGHERWEYNNPPKAHLSVEFKNEKTLVVQTFMYQEKK